MTAKYPATWKNPDPDPTNSTTNNLEVGILTDGYGARPVVTLEDDDGDLIEVAFESLPWLIKTLEDLHYSHGTGAKLDPYDTAGLDPWLFSTVHDAVQAATKIIDRLQQQAAKDTVHQADILGKQREKITHLEAVLAESRRQLAATKNEHKQAIKRLAEHSLVIAKLEWQDNETPQKALERVAYQAQWKKHFHGLAVGRFNALEDVRRALPLEAANTAHGDLATRVKELIADRALQKDTAQNWKHEADRRRNELNDIDNLVPWRFWSRGWNTTRRVGALADEWEALKKGHAKATEPRSEKDARTIRGLKGEVKGLKRIIDRLVCKHNDLDDTPGKHSRAFLESLRKQMLGIPRPITTRIRYQYQVPTEALEPDGDFLDLIDRYPKMAMKEMQKAMASNILGRPVTSDWWVPEDADDTEECEGPDAGDTPTDADSDVPVIQAKARPESLEPLQPNRKVHCEKCGLLTVEGACGQTAVGLKCPQCGDCWSITEGWPEVKLDNNATVKFMTLDPMAEPKSRAEVVHMDESPMELDGWFNKFVTLNVDWNTRVLDDLKKLLDDIHAPKPKTPKTSRCSDCVNYCGYRPRTAAQKGSVLCLGAMDPGVTRWWLTLGPVPDGLHRIHVTPACPGFKPRRS